MDARLFAQFEFLRAHVESVAEAPSTIMVTSAKARDGKTLTAHGLAERLADAGRRVVLVDYSSLANTRATENVSSRARVGYPVIRLPIEEEGTSISTLMLRAKIEELRSAYDFTIVDSAPLLTSRVATLLASMVDTIIVTVRLGRPSDSDDAALIESLGRAEAGVLGVVAAAAADIEWYASEQTSFEPDRYVSPTYPVIADLPASELGIVPTFETSRS